MDAFILKFRFALKWKKLFSLIALLLFVAGMLLLALCLQNVNAFSATFTSVGNFNQDISSRLASTSTSLSTNVSGYIITDSTWTLAGSPYLVVEDVVIYPGSVLTIEPGVLVKFSNGTSLITDGRLIACGNATDKITFTSDSVAPEPGDWTGIFIHSIGFCNITNAIIEYATTGVDFNILEQHNIFRQNQLISNIIGIRCSGYQVGPDLDTLTIKNNTDSGIFLDDEGSVNIANSLISNNKIGIRGGENPGLFSVNNCTISNNTNDGISTDGIRFTIENSKINNNGGRGLYINRDLDCSNTIISNNSGDGLYIRLRNNFPSLAKIINCNISFNNGIGVWSDSDVDIESAIISSNAGTGVVVAGSIDIAYSSVIDNGNIGIISTGTYYLPLGLSYRDIHYCNLYNNGLYDLKNMGIDLNADFNWWGTNNESQISIRVYDHFDNPSVTGTVNCRPFLNSSSATLTILTSGVPSNTPVQVHIGAELGLVNDGAPLSMTFYSGATQPEMGWLSLSIDNSKISSDNSTTCTFINWTSSEGNSTSNSITLLIAGNTFVTAFYGTQVVPEFPSTTILLFIMILASTIFAIMGRKHR